MNTHSTLYMHRISRGLLSTTWFEVNRKCLIRGLHTLYVFYYFFNKPNWDIWPYAIKFYIWIKWWDISHYETELEQQKVTCWVKTFWPCKRMAALHKSSQIHIVIIPPIRAKPRSHWFRTGCQDSMHHLSSPFLQSVSPYFLLLSNWSHSSIHFPNLFTPVQGWAELVPIPSRQGGRRWVHLEQKTSLWHLFYI